MSEELKLSADEAYNLIDRFLRNNLDDTDYATFSDALEVLATPDAAEAGKDAIDAARYRKLRGWMSSNVPEGWSEVERVGAVAAWMSWEDADQYLDALPMCNVGLMERAPAAPLGGA